MWIRLNNEFLNLDQVYRIKFGKGWRKDGNSESTADIEGFVNGEIHVMSRYRGTEAELLYSVLQNHCVFEPAAEPATSFDASETPSSSADAGTVHDF